MKARIVFDPPTDRTLVYVWQEQDDGRKVARYRDAVTGAPMITVVPEGGELPVFAVWGSDETEAITAALLDDAGPPPAELDDALIAEISGSLDDARIVRDRLLALVERLAE